MWTNSVIHSPLTQWTSDYLDIEFTAQTNTDPRLTQFGDKIALICEPPAQLSYATRADARADMLEYIEEFSNPTMLVGLFRELSLAQ